MLFRSHSYNHWNSGRPIDTEHWGISLWATQKKDMSALHLFEAKAFVPEGVIAEIVGVTDRERESRSFKLKEDTRLRVMAIGEGVGNEMADYGWIENEAGKVIWEMTMGMTEHAGGANKNRIFNDIIMLPAGSYRVVFETDSSHSYKDWNATPPTQADRYGITLTVEE